MECPFGMKGIEKITVILKKKIYGLVQAARQYNKQAVEVLKKVGFIRGNVDPSKGILYIALYVDDI